MDILKVLQSIWYLPGNFLYSLLLLIVSYYTPDCIPLIMLLNYSGHDHEGVCNVESIQKDPLYPLVHLCATGCGFLCFCRCLLQFQYLLLRYVSS